MTQRRFALLVFLVVVSGSLSAQNPRHWCTFLGGGDHDEEVSAVASAANGDVIVAGHTRSTDFRTTSGVFQPKNAGLQDIFVARFSPDGKRLLAATLLGGSSRDLASAVRVANDGSIWVCGTTSSSDFPTTADRFATTGGGGADAFVANLDSGLQTLRYATGFGGPGNDTGEAFVLDEAKKRIYLAGTGGAGVPTTATAFQSSPLGVDAYVAVLDRTTPQKTTLFYSTLIGGGLSESALDGLSVGTNGVCTVTGTTVSNDFPLTPTALQSTRSGLSSGFLARIDPAKSGAQSLVYGTYFGGSAREWALRNVQDAGGLLHLLLVSESSNLPTTPNALQKLPGRGSDVFYAQLDATKSGAAGLRYGSWIAAGPGSEGLGLPGHGAALALSGSRIAIFVTTNMSAGLPATPGAFQTSAESFRGYARLLDVTNDPAIVYATHYTGCPNTLLEPRAVAFHSSGDLLLGGKAHGAHGAPATSNAVQGLVSGTMDGFLGRLEPAAWPASVLTLGTSCPGSAGTPSLSALAGARLCRTLRVQATGLGVRKVGVMFLGSHKAWNSIPLPFPLPATGCTLYAGPLILFPSATGSGTVQFKLPVPGARDLLELEFALQYAILDASANALGVVLTNGLLFEVRW